MISETLNGKKVLVTAGPTHEPIDPVRFIGNHSSGKMGYAICEALKNKGAEVILVTGPSCLSVPEGIQVEKVKTAQQMYEACAKHFDQVDVGVLAAAVADYTPKVVADKKIKKKEDSFSLELVKTTDIAKELGQVKATNQVLVGFALETNDELANARKKLESKNFDFIVLNSLNKNNECFGVDDNKITIVDKEKELYFNSKSKTEVAKDIVAHIETVLQLSIAQ